jgi:hypothetical protein
MGKKSLMVTIQKNFPNLKHLYISLGSFQEVANSMKSNKPELFEGYMESSIWTAACHALKGRRNIPGLISQEEFDKIKTTQSNPSKKILAAQKQISSKIRAKRTRKGNIKRGLLDWELDDRADFFLSLRDGGKYLLTNGFPNYAEISNIMNERYNPGKIVYNCSNLSNYSSRCDKSFEKRIVDWKKNYSFMGSEFSLEHIALFYMGRREVQLFGKGNGIGSYKEAIKYLERKFPDLEGIINYDSFSKIARKAKKSLDFNSEYERMLEVMRGGDNKDKIYLESKTNSVDDLNKLDKLISRCDLWYIDIGQKPEKHKYIELVE